jgi:hypothetical protein
MDEPFRFIAITGFGMISNCRCQAHKHSIIDAHYRANEED